MYRIERLASAAVVPSIVTTGLTEEGALRYWLQHHDGATDPHARPMYIVRESDGEHMAIEGTATGRGSSAPAPPVPTPAAPSSTPSSRPWAPPPSKSRTWGRRWRQ